MMSDDEEGMKVEAVSIWEKSEVVQDSNYLRCHSLNVSKREMIKSARQRPANASTIQYLTGCELFPVIRFHC